MLDAIMASRGFTKGERTVAYSEPVRRVDRKAKKQTRKALSGMSAALKKANKIARKKNGDFRKGYNQKRVMQMAHKFRRQR